MEFSLNGIKSKTNLNFKKLSGNKFEFSEVIERENYLLWIGDFNEKNFKITTDKSQTFFSFDNLSSHQLSDDKSIRAHSKQEGYSPSIIYNELNKEICIITDPFGLHYIYISAIDDNRIVITSHLKYIVLREPSVLNKLDYNALIEYIYSHCILGYKTFFSDIRLLPYNSVLKFRNWGIDANGAIEKALKKKEFWYEFPTTYDDIDDIKDKVNNIGGRISALIEDLYNSQKRNLAFFLSGGLDSRTLVSAIPDKYKTRSEALTFDSSPNGIEMRNAVKVAETVKILHHKQIISSQDIVDNCFRHLWLSEGLSNHVVSILLPLIEGRIEGKVVIDGFAGDAQFGGEFLSDIDDYIHSYENNYERLIAIVANHEYAFPKETFYSIMREPEDILNKAIEKGFKNHSELIWPSKNDMLELENLLTLTRARCYTLGGIRTARNFSPVILPYYHPEVYSEYISVPPKFRKKRFLEMGTIKYLNPDVSMLSSTSSQWYIRILKIARFGYRALSYLESKTHKRLIPKYTAVPYFEWMREEGSYRSLINNLLNNDNCLIWNLMNVEATRKLFNDFFIRKNHLHKFLNHIIDLEITLRLFYSIKDSDDEIILFNNVTGGSKIFQVNLPLTRAKKVTKGPY
jgi:asparagine synthetase B (glutamine-hydrolysing)